MTVRPALRPNGWAPPFQLETASNVPDFNWILMFVTFAISALGIACLVVLTPARQSHLPTWLRPTIDGT